MTNKTRPYRELLLERLTDPEVAAHYLNEALETSREGFLQALRNVAQARQMTAVAKDAGLQRESLYRALSGEGNPTLENFTAILAAVGLKISITTDVVKRAA